MTTEQEPREGGYGIDRYIGQEIVSAGWRISDLYLDQDVSYVAYGVAGLWECEIEVNPRRRFWQEPIIARGRGVSSKQAIEDAYNEARRIAGMMV